jgi:hypothetical protein
MRDSYQDLLWDKFSGYRPEPTYPVYPPYHTGEYLEDYFMKRFMEDPDGFERYFIPVGWTTSYIEDKTGGLQDLLNQLDPDKKYFTVAQHDDAIREKLPPDTISFNAGGNGGGIPIPLICSPIPSEIALEQKTSIFASFVGSITHSARANMMISLQDKTGYRLATRRWTDSVPQSDQDAFMDITSKSAFCLCPRGYGKSSFRLYEAMQLGAIPVYIYDTPWLPFTDELKWNEFSVLVHIDHIFDLDNILKEYGSNPAHMLNMKNRMREVWESHFSMEGLFNQIKKRAK